MGTAAVTGVYFPVGVSLCRLVNQHRRETGLRCAARPTDGSVANIAGLRDGRLGARHRAVRRPGAGRRRRRRLRRRGPVRRLRAVMALHPEPLTLVARADAGIAEVEDLAGKRVWLGPEGSGTRALAGELMAALGWTETSFAPVPPPRR